MKKIPRDIIILHWYVSQKLWSDDVTIIYGSSEIMVHHDGEQVDRPMGKKSDI